MSYLFSMNWYNKQIDDIKKRSIKDECFKFHESERLLYLQILKQVYSDLNVGKYIMMKICENFYQFLPSSKNTQLPESDMERGGQVWPILLLYDDSIDSTGQGGGIDLVVETFDIGENSTHIAEVTHIQLLSGTLGYGSLLNPGTGFSVRDP